MPTIHRNNVKLFCIICDTKWKACILFLWLTGFTRKNFCSLRDKLFLSSSQWLLACRFIQKTPIFTPRQHPNAYFLAFNSNWWRSNAVFRADGQCKFITTILVTTSSKSTLATIVHFLTRSTSGILMSSMCEYFMSYMRSTRKCECQFYGGFFFYLVFAMHSDRRTEEYFIYFCSSFRWMTIWWAVGKLLQDWLKIDVLLTLGNKFPIELNIWNRTLWRCM